MGLRIRVFFWLLTAIAFGYDFYVWGGLEATPVVGRELLKEAPFAPLASTYMFLGEKVNGTLRTSEAARGFAARRFPELLAEPLDLDKVSVARFTAAQSLGGKLAYYGAPLLLVLSFVLHVLRQKRIRSFGGVD